MLVIKVSVISQFSS
jgi:hypothetical protein